MQTDTRVHRFLALLPATASISILLSVSMVALSCLVGTGPGADIDSPKMTATVGLGFVLAAVALGLLSWTKAVGQQSQRVTAMVTLSGAAVVAIGGIILLDYISGLPWNLAPRLHELLADGNNSGNQVSPQAAINFTLLGLALLAHRDGASSQVAIGQSLAWTTVLLTPAVLIGHSYGAASFYSTPPMIDMSLSSAFNFMLLGLGVLCIRPECGLRPLLTRPSRGGTIPQRWSPAIMLMPLMLGWLALQGLGAGVYDARSALALFTLASAVLLGVLVWYMAGHINKEDQRISTEELHRHVLELAPDSIVVTAADQRIVLTNARTEELFGYSQADLRDRSTGLLWYTPLGAEATAEHIGRHRDGHEFPLEITTTTAEVAGEQLSTHVIRDTSAHKHIEQQITRLTHLYAALSQTNQAIVRLRDQDGLFRRVCRIAIDHGHFKFAWIGLLDAAGRELRPVAHSGPVGTYLDGLAISATSDDDAHKTVAKALLGNDYHVNNDVLVGPSQDRAEAAGVRSEGAFTLRREGKVVGALVLHAQEPKYFDPPVIDLCLEMARDISLAMDSLHRETRRREAEERVLYWGQFDSLTGLPNATLLEDRLLQALAKAQRKKTPVVVLLLDLDRFKTVNDSLGHHLGDRLLQAVTERLQSCLRGSDTVSRRGGDEFVIVLPDIRDAQDAVHVAEKILDSVSQPYALEGYELNITTSIGISTFPQDGQDMRSLIKNADAAMYHAKEHGRNQFQFFAQDMNAMAFEQLMMENHLRRAVERNEFILHYQPQVDIETSRIIGAEALIRWQHPELGLVPPDQFIPIAEDNGLILPIGEWALHEASHQNRRWQDAGLPAFPVAVNMSAIQFRKQDIQDTVAQVLKDSGLAPRFLELELTERSIMKDAEDAARLLGELKQMGVQLSIDDFGTGYSSLNYLKRFPLDKLKIDRSFVKDIPLDMDDAAITQAIIGMAHSLRLRVIAEGAETRDQHTFLRSQHCDEIQGYYFSKPLPADHFTRLLQAGGRLQPQTMH